MLCRWRNHGTRTFSVYARESNPWPELKYLVKFQAQCYSPMVIDIFFHPEFHYGSHHLYMYLKRTKTCLNREHFSPVKQYFLTNAYWFHPENILICGLVSLLSTPEIKAKALKLILQARARERGKNTGEIRYFILPTEDQLNFDAPNFFEVLRWNELEPEYITPPPLLRNFSDNELIESLNGTPLNIPRFLCHSQHCENAVQKTTAAVTKNIGHTSQISNIVAAGSSREQYPKSNSQKLKNEDFLS